MNLSVPPGADLPSDRLDRANGAAGVSSRPFGFLPDGRQAFLHELSLPSGWSVSVTDLGAALVRVVCPVSGSHDSEVRDLVLGYGSAAEYASCTNYMGVICGRSANRIRDGHLPLQAGAHQLSINESGNHLHGGHTGFGKRLWRVAPGEALPGMPSITLTIESAAGEEGYPGTVRASVTYALESDGCLRIEMRATTDAETIVNLAQHAYWNLAGHDQGTVLDHELVLFADHYLEMGAGQIPTGRRVRVESTALDMRACQPHRNTLGDVIAALPEAELALTGGGVDHCFLVRDWKPDGELRSVAALRDPVSGRTLRLMSDQPGLQVYTANRLIPDVAGKGGVRYAVHAGVCLETQHLPDAVHHDLWPSPRLRPGDEYRHSIRYLIET